LSTKSVIINKEFDASIVQTILKRFWWWPLVFIAFFSGVSYIYLRYTRPVFESSLIIQLDSEDNAKDILAIENLNSKTEGDLSSQIQLLQSQLLFERAIQRIPYNVSLFSKGNFLTEERYLSSSFNVQPYQLKDSSIINVPIHLEFDGKKVLLYYEHNGKNFKLSGKLDQHFVNQHFDVIIKAPYPKELKADSDENDLYFVFNSVQTFAARFLPSLKVFPSDQVAKTIQVSFQGNNPQLCHDLALAVAETFLQYDNEIKRKSSAKILAFIDQQLDSLAGELKDSKDSLMFYQRKSNLADPEQVTNSLTDNITTLQNSLFEVENDIRTLNTVSSKLRADPNRLEVYRLMPDMMGKSYEGALLGQLNELHLLLEKKEDLLFRVTEEHSEVKSINQRVQFKLNSIRKSIGVIMDRLNATGKVLISKIQSYEGEFFELPEKKMEFNRLKNIQDLNEKYFSLLTEKKVMYAISDAGFASNNRILTRPVVNNVPISPNKKLIYTTFIFLGFAMGLAVLFFKYLTFNEVNVLDDLKKLLPEKVSILGSVPLVTKNTTFSSLLVHSQPKSMLSENMRKLRTNLNYVHPNYQTIAISSSISGEGKTFVALNLAGIIAMSGKKTILLDLDLRRPKVHLGLGIENEVGMSGLIVGEFKLEECIRNSEIPSLDFITAGPVPPNPSELLLSDRFKELVAELKSTYEVIVIDNPPIGLVSDGVNILSEADIPIYIFKSHYSKRNFAFRVKELFDMQQITKLNVILNGVKNVSGGYGYGYGYGYGLYHDNNYYVEEKKPSRSWKRFFRKNKDK
jgi:tyrosine-protein kinase Etk/Wzc